MRNDEVGRVFARIADLLELKGDTGFRTRSYQRAARAIEHWAVPVEQVARQGDLTEIPGVGNAIAKKVQELVDTGRLEYFERLAAEFPPGIEQLLAVPGIGPKTALMIAQALGVSTTEDLEAAAQDGRLAALPRFGDKAAENVLRSLRSTRRRDIRHPIGRVVPVLDQVIEYLGGETSISELAPVGSVRRYAETVGDLDIAVASASPEDVMETFGKAPFVHQVQNAGPVRANILIDADLQIDLRVVPKHQWGSMLQYFTGSREHNVLLRERARRDGLSVSEYGVRRLGDDGLETFTDETSFYRRLGLDWIPPEIREGGNEINAAESGEIPRLIEVGDLVGDLHVHSDWSDGADSLEAMVAAAAARGLQYVAITDHSHGRGIARGLSVERLHEQRRAIENLRRRFTTIHILHGSEVDIRADGTLDYPDDILAWLDFVVASVHSGMTEGSDRMTARLVRAMQNPFVTCIGHLSARVIGEREPVEFAEDEVFRVAAATRTALEINASPNRMDLCDRHALRARELGVPLMINTDSHGTHGFDAQRFGVGVARRAWCSAADIVNTATWPEFQRFLTQKRAHGVELRIT